MKDIILKKCPFCLNLNTLIFVEVETDDCVRECIECTNCGLRSPGAEFEDCEDNEQNFLDIDCEVSMFWNELSDNMLNVWNRGEK